MAKRKVKMSTSISDVNFSAAFGDEIDIDADVAYRLCSSGQATPIGWELGEADPPAGFIVDDAVDESDDDGGESDDDGAGEGGAGEEPKTTATAEVATGVAGDGADGSGDDDEDGVGVTGDVGSE